MFGMSELLVHKTQVSGKQHIALFSFISLNGALSPHPVQFWWSSFLPTLCKDLSVLVIFYIRSTC